MPGPFRETMPLLNQADLSQMWRLFLARHHIGSIFTPLVVQAEIGDRLYPDTADTDVSPADLLGFYESIAATDDFRDHYRMLAQPVPNNENKPRGEQRIWFDAIEGLTNEPILRNVARYARKYTPKGKESWEHAVDLGAGTGVLGRMLVESEAGRPPIAAWLTMVDAVPEILEVAEARSGQDIDYHCGNVLDLKIDDNSYDLAVSGGLAYLLGNDLQVPFFRQVHRLLRPGGMYIDGDQHQSEWTTDNPGRFQLNRLIIGHLAGKEMLGDPLSHREDFPFIPYSYAEKREFFAGLGFDMQQHYVEHSSGYTIVIRVLVKQSESGPTDTF